ncbi:MAG: hypothetical protein EA401_08535 [Planctomycetota bacterium]|nr:MAG: hypothetical protein EA401_08535 [Planctomycetota bacterium]
MVRFCSIVRLGVSVGALLCSIPLAFTVEGEDGRAAFTLGSVWEHLGFALLGSLIVFTTLLGLWGICWLVGRCFAGSTPSAQGSSPQSVAAGLDPEVVAVISAAVATTLKAPHTIVSLRPRENKDTDV